MTMTETTRLSNASLPDLVSAARPHYDRSTVTPGIVHLGIGNFHRAHQAVYVDDGLASDPAWGIVGASLRRPDMHDALTPQDGLYMLGIRSNGQTRIRVIGALLRIIDASRDSTLLLDELANPAIRVVSLTVTEKGYCHDPATGNLDGAHAAIRADLDNPDRPVSVPGLLVAALESRRQAGGAPFTLLSCDNLPANGRTLKRLVTQMAALRNDGLAGWIEASVAFPSTMVDRIVPATTDADRKEMVAATGLADAWPVMSEPFSQWVIEDGFSTDRPPLPGAQFVCDVAPYERMKLRMLNGAHSSMAWLGQLAGYDTVAEVTDDPLMLSHIDVMWQDEVMPTLDMPVNELEAYARALTARFSNHGLRHRTAQIAMDSSQKIPQRLLETIGDLKRLGLPHGRLSAGVAAWLAVASGRAGAPAPDDPMREHLLALASRYWPDTAAYANAVLDMGTIFGALSDDPAFRLDIASRLETFVSRGWRAVLLEFQTSG